jgi:hypothetical protein
MLMSTGTLEFVPKTKSLPLPVLTSFPN